MQGKQKASCRRTIDSYSPKQFNADVDPFRRSGLIVVDSSETNNPKNEDYCLNLHWLVTKKRENWEWERNSIRSPGRQKKWTRKIDNIFTLIRKLNTALRALRIWDNSLFIVVGEQWFPQLKSIVESEAKDSWTGKWALLLNMISKPRQEQLPEETVRFPTLSWPIYMKCLLSKNIFVLSFL